MYVRCSKISNTIDKQNTLRHDCIYNIENSDLEIGVSGVYLHLLYYFDTHRRELSGRVLDLRPKGNL